MSRGPGRIERAIRELFDAHPDLAFVTRRAGRALLSRSQAGVRSAQA
jgi:hypothetical protein